MKLPNFIKCSLYILLTINLQALELDEKKREWKREDGQVARARLVDIMEDKIGLEIKRKTHVFPLSDFSEKDRKYVQSVIADLPSGNIEKYVPKFSDEENKEFYDKHGMQSLVWRGDSDREVLTMLVYQPARKLNEKLPVIIYLHGTGGLGLDNAKPFFHCGGEAAKHLLAESFQKKHRCIVITPQTQRHVRN